MQNGSNINKAIKIGSYIYIGLAGLFIALTFYIANAASKLPENATDADVSGFLRFCMNAVGVLMIINLIFFMVLVGMALINYLRNLNKPKTLMDANVKKERFPMIQFITAVIFFFLFRIMMGLVFGA